MAAKAGSHAQETLYRAVLEQNFSSGWALSQIKPVERNRTHRNVGEQKLQEFL